MAIEVQAPKSYTTEKYSIFLGGAIDMGHEKTQWQKRVVKALGDLDVLVLNPRRDDWDESWEQCKNCEPFREQVLWEIKAQEDCDLLLYVYLKDSKAPITMFENGAWGTKKDCIMCVEEGFWKKANLDIYAEHFKIQNYSSLDDMIADLRTALR